VIGLALRLRIALRLRRGAGAGPGSFSGSIPAGARAPEGSARPLETAFDRSGARSGGSARLLPGESPGRSSGSPTGGRRRSADAVVLLAVFLVCCGSPSISTTSAPASSTSIVAYLWTFVTSSEYSPSSWRAGPRSRNLTRRLRGTSSRPPAWSRPRTQEGAHTPLCPHPSRRPLSFPCKGDQHARSGGTCRAPALPPRAPRRGRHSPALTSLSSNVAGHQDDWELFSRKRGLEGPLEPRCKTVSSTPPPADAGRIDAGGEARERGAVASVRAGGGSRAAGRRRRAVQ